MARRNKGGMKVFPESGVDSDKVNYANYDPREMFTCDWDILPGQDNAIKRFIDRQTDKDGNRIRHRHMPRGAGVGRANSAKNIDEVNNRNC